MEVWIIVLAAAFGALALGLGVEVRSAGRRMARLAEQARKAEDAERQADRSWSAPRSVPSIFCARSRLLPT